MITSSEAKQLCAKGEYELFALSRPRTIKILTVKELKSRIQRSRKARDKFAKMTGEQQRQARGKQAPKGTRPSKGSQRTSRKQQLFAETLARYEARLSVLEQLETDAPAQENPASNQVKNTKKKAVKKPPSKVAKKSKVTKSAEPAKQTKLAKKAVTKGTKKKAVTRTKKAAAKQAPTRKKKPASVSSRATVPKKDKAKKNAVANTKSGTALRQSAQLSNQMRSRKHLSAQSRRNQSRRDSR